MANYVIAGKPDCPHFVHVAHVCSYLEKNLPAFKYKKIQVKSEDWPSWLSENNLENGWFNKDSPVIWKEVAKSGGKPTLIGGISDFWEYCYDYYGLESVLPEEDLRCMVEDNKQFFDASEKEQLSLNGSTKEGLPGAYTIVTIMGIHAPHIRIFLPELMKVEGLTLNKIVVLRLFDLDVSFSTDADDILDLMSEILTMNTFVYLVTTFKEALDNCDLFINLFDSGFNENEDLDCWRIRHTYTALMIADHINSYAKKTLKVVFASIGAPVCFNASVMCYTCTRIKLTNVIAITADWGTCALNLVAKECNIPLSELGAPPVWGFLNHTFIDVGSIIKKCEIRRPYLRALRTNGGSTLPLGKITPELRYINYLTDGIPQLWEKVEEIRYTALKRLGRPPSYSKLAATMTALRIWFSNKPSDEVISLGILSNGCFGFPTGIIVSQPAIFNGKSWVPFKDFPMQEYSKREVEKLVDPISTTIDYYDVRKSTRARTIMQKFSV